MGLMPSLGGVDVARSVDTVISLLTRINHKLAELIALETARQERETKDAGCLTCDESGRLRCPKHGPVKVPGVGPVRLTEVPDDVDAEDMQPDVPPSYPVLWAADLRDKTDETHGPYGYTGPGGDSQIVTRWVGIWLVRDSETGVWVPEPRIPTWPGLFSLMPPHERARLSGPVDGFIGQGVVF